MKMQRADQTSKHDALRLNQSTSQYIVIASEAKQSRGHNTGVLDCFGATRLAMTNSGNLLELDFITL